MQTTFKQYFTPKNYRMAIKITEECINCGACEPECPNNVIYEGGVEWAISDGTSVKGSFTFKRMALTCNSFSATACSFVMRQK